MGPFFFIGRAGVCHHAPAPDLGRIPPPDSTRPRPTLLGSICPELWFVYPFFSAKAVGRLRRTRPPDLGCTSPPDSTRPHAFRVYLSGALGYLSLFLGLFIICLLQDPGKILQDPVHRPAYLVQPCSTILVPPGQGIHFVLQGRRCPERSRGIRESHAHMCWRK